MRRDTKQHPNLSVWNEEEFETLAMKEEQLPETYRSPSIPIEECSLRVVDGPHKGEELKLESDIYHIGRADWCDLCLVQDKWVSGHHCIIYVGTDGVQVRDKGSRNGIFLGGHRVFDALLTPGSLLRVGESVLEVYSTHTQKELSIKYYDASKKLVGRSERMRQLFSMLPRLARRNVPILFTGETGTGKTTFAKILHEQSPRKHKPFVSVNCGALPASLIESELFGHEKGAFTGATKQTKGYFEQADGGTLFLDEIGELPLSLQPKLLDVLERQRIRRLGGTKEIEVDFRLLTATHRNLTDDVQDGCFRQDLYYRLSVVTLEIPSLRERREDIPLLTPRILHQLAPDEEFQLTHDAQKALQEYLWPGNVRELRNILQRTIALLDGNIIDAKALNLSPMKEQSLSQDAPPPPTIPENITLPSVGDAPVSLKDLIAQTEREILRQMLEKTENVEQAAKLLEISKGWFYNRIKKYDLELPNKKE